MLGKCLQLRTGEIGAGHFDEHLDGPLLRRDGNGCVLLQMSGQERGRSGEDADASGEDVQFVKVQQQFTARQVNRRDDGQLVVAGQRTEAPNQLQGRVAVQTCLRVRRESIY